MECVERALTRCILPDFKSELKRTLLMEAKESVLKACCRKLYNWIKVSVSSTSLLRLICKSKFELGRSV